MSLYVSVCLPACLLGRRFVAPTPGVPGKQRLDPMAPLHARPAAAEPPQPSFTAALGRSHPS
eukprot:4021812-Lingulodinium_polyedra.AAC.1